MRCDCVGPSSTHLTVLCTRGRVAGTGNDLHRSLGWGSHTPSSSKLRGLVSFAGRLGDAARAEKDKPSCSSMDFWEVGFKNLVPKYSPLMMQNYFSVGVLADCAEKVHELRYATDLAAARTCARLPNPKLAWTVGAPGPRGSVKVSMCARVAD